MLIIVRANTMDIMCCQLNSSCLKTEQFVNTKQNHLEYYKFPVTLDNYNQSFTIK